MADLKHIRQRISEIAGRRKNVTLAEIEWVVNQLGQNGYKTKVRGSSHNRLVSVGSIRFGVCAHNPGSKQVKRCYVDEFLDAMTELGLYEE